ncbi:MAG: SLC13 family permease [Acidobacteriota bacterium]|nr:SLC13 family permease [Acidobacteriota bacterium]
MTWAAWFVLAITALVVIGLARNLAADALLWGAVIACGMAGILSLPQMFVGFTNTGMLTIAALYVVAAGVRETGALDLVGRAFLGRVRTLGGVMGRLGLAVPLLSAFLNNTPVVAMFIPMLSRWCAKHRVSPSRLLIPLSYMSILGGMTTLIGTSTNLVVQGMMAEATASNPALGESLRPMGLFEIGAVGLPCALLGIGYLLLFSRYLVPERTDMLEQIGTSPREYLVEMEVQPSCRLVGQHVEEAGLRHLHGLFLAEIIRDGELIAPVQPDHVIEAGDVLTFSGVVRTIVELEKIPGLTPVADPDYEHELSEKREKLLSEAVVSPTSPLIGQSIRDSNFRAHYNAAVVAVHRGGARLAKRLGDIVLQSGDTLLLQTGPHFDEAHRNNRDFFLVSRVSDSKPPRHDRALLSLVLLGVLVALLTSQIIPTVLAAFLVAGAMILTGCISVAEARASLDLQTLFAIAGAIALGQALLISGAVQAIADAAVSTLGAWGPYAVLAGIAVLTMLFTEVVTNTAAAALMFPLGVVTAVDLGVDPRPFVMVVALIASASFLTPIGYQTNLMVYGPGGYRFTDFGRVGLPLSLLILVMATLLAPMVWRF